MAEIMTFILQSLFQNTFISRRPRVDTFDDQKTVTIFLKTMFKDSNKLERIRNYVPKCISIFLDIAKFADITRTQEVCHVIHIFLGSPVGKV